MKFYAYIPTKDGHEPSSYSSRLLFELKTVAGGHRRARSRLGPRYRLFVYTHFYRKGTYKEV